MNMQQNGFSLIELLIAVAVIGILSSIVYPQYQGYTCDTYKGQAVVDLKVCALSLDRYYSDGFTFVGATVSGLAASVCKNQSPVDGQKKFDITVSQVTANSYTLKATPIAGQSCGSVIQLTAAGVMTGQ